MNIHIRVVSWYLGRLTYVTTSATTPGGALAAYRKHGNGTPLGWVAEDDWQTLKKTVASDTMMQAAYAFAKERGQLFDVPSGDVRQKLEALQLPAIAVATTQDPKVKHERMSHADQLMYQRDQVAMARDPKPFTRTPFDPFADWIGKPGFDVVRGEASSVNDQAGRHFGKFVSPDLVTGR
jgi:hypothetical protein